MIQAKSHPIPSRGSGTSEAMDHPWVCVVGDATSAVVETAQSGLIFADDVVAWVPQPVSATVTVAPDGEVTVESDELEPATSANLAASFRAALRDAGLVQLEHGRRYLTRHYAALDRVEAERLAAIDGTALDRIAVAEVTLIHATRSWAVWSDGRVTTSTGLPAWTKQTRRLSDAAASLIDRVRGSDSGSPRLAGGYGTLVRVASMVESSVWSGADRRPYASASIVRLDLVLSDGEKRTAYVFSEGYSDGYIYEIVDTEAEARAVYEGVPRGA